MTGVPEEIVSYQIGDVIKRDMVKREEKDGVTAYPIVHDEAEATGYMVRYVRTIGETECGVRDPATGGIKKITVTSVTGGTLRYEPKEGEVVELGDYGF